MDWLLEQAEKNGIYVILDMHGCPGGQTKDHCDGVPKEAALLYDPEYQDIMEELWIAIAERYRGNPAVAGYDIMNEAQDYDGGVESDPRNAIYDRMYRAIREIDSEHIIFIEAIWDFYRLPTPQQAGWENVIYETHPYGEKDAEAYCRRILEYSRTNQVPVYVGEFSDMNMLDAFKKYGISCTSWTYKGTVYAEGTWYMYYTDQVKAADVCSDPYWLLKLKWGNCIRTQFYEPAENVLVHFQEAD